MGEMNGGTASPDGAGPDDPLAIQRPWHIRNPTGWDLNLVPVWADYTGAGVHVAVYDSGVQTNHPNLDRNYDASRHVIVNGAPQNQDPGKFARSDGHGTAVAGVIAAGYSESLGVPVGVAYDAGVTGVQIYSAVYGIDSSVLSQAMAQQRNFDVVNHSWGYWGDAWLASQTSTHPDWIDFFQSIRNAADLGRGGLGTAMVIAAGNDRRNGPGYNDHLADNGLDLVTDTNASNFTNDRHMITVGAVDPQGAVLDYSTPGASILVSAFSGSWSGAPHAGILATDMAGAYGFTTEDTVNFVGTSAAAPQVSGVVALMLEANPNLGWRDIREILAYSARGTGAASFAWNGAGNWNGGGLHFSNDVGFGVVDALGAVRLAESWTQQQVSANEAHVQVGQGANTPIPDLGAAGFVIPVSQNIGIETVALTLRGTHTWMGDLVVTLTSPDGTQSVVLDRVGSNTDMPANGWIMTSNAFLGGMSAGNWGVTVTDNARGDSGTITGLTLDFYGNATAADDTYVYTNEFGSLGWATGHGFEGFDTDGGADTINAAAVGSDTIIDYVNGTYTIAGQTGYFGGGGSDPAFYAIENIITGDGNDTIGGNFVDNTLRGMRGNDAVEGAGGTDTAVFSGHRTDYAITPLGSGAWRVTDLRDGSPDGSDRLSGVERLDFLADGITLPVPAVAHDFNGDRSADMLLQAGSTVVQWCVQEGAYAGGSALTTTLPTGWTVAGTGDFNLDGLSDVLLQGGGTVAAWFLNATGQYIGGNTVGTGLAPGWNVAGTGDVNRDGITDVVLQGDGMVVDWILNASGNYQSGNVLATGLPSNWDVVGVGDLNGDAVSDLLLQGGSTVVDWLLDASGGYAGGNVLTTALPLGWTARALGDFNGDGTSDVALQGGNYVVDWIMQNGNVVGGHVISSGLPAGWNVVGTGDYNSDGTSDLSLQGDGTVVNWLLSDGQYAGGNVLATNLPEGWTVVGKT